MRMEHVAIYMSDIEKGREFFERYFGGKSNQKYSNKNTGFSSYFISFTDGSRLELMTNTSLHEGHKIDNQTGYSHIAFSVGSKEKVMELTEQIRMDGYRVLSNPRTTGDGYFESCVADLEGNRIEITI